MGSRAGGSGLALLVDPGGEAGHEIAQELPRRVVGQFTGLDATPVEIEVYVSLDPRNATCTIVGLPDKALQEARSRIRSARPSSSVVQTPPSPHWIGLWMLSDQTPMWPIVPLWEKP